MLGNGKGRGGAGGGSADGGGGGAGGDGAERVGDAAGRWARIVDTLVQELVLELVVSAAASLLQVWRRRRNRLRRLRGER